MTVRRFQLRQLTIDAILLALALVLSIVERWIPLELIVPVPGLKLGLANIVTLFALLRLKPQDAFAILIVRCLVMGAFTGPMTLLFSLAGGILALLVMWMLRSQEGKAFSVIGISLAGAAAHNIGQTLIAALVLQEPLLMLAYLPPLLLTGLVTGTLTGIAAFPVVRLWKGNGTKPPAVMATLLMLSAVLLLAPLPLSGCANGSATTHANQPGELKKYSYEFTGTFDTVIQLIGYARDEVAFAEYTKTAEKRFRELHQLFDTFNDYQGLNNLKTINDQAGAAPVKVAPELLQLIKKSIGWNRTISDKTNIALGRTILLWQRFRDEALTNPENASVPGDAEILETLAHIDVNNIQIDEEAETVFVADPDMRLDLGAVGKGYAAEMVAQEMIAMGVTSMIINAGGSNVRLIGKPADERETWSVGLQNPRALLPDGPAADTPVGTAETTSATTSSTTLTTTSTAEPDLTAILHINGTSIVTSGDYQRYYQVDGTVYHHLIDPADGQPARYFRAVTVVAEDSGLADFLSTALFLMPYEDGLRLAERLSGVEVLWIFAGGRLEMTSGLKDIIEVNP